MLSLDIETRSLLDLRRTGSERYARDPGTEVLLLAWARDGEPVQIWQRGEPPPAALFSVLEEETYVRAWNAGFERAIWTHILHGRLGWPEIPLSRFLCTASLAARCALPRNLEDAAQVLGLPVEKDRAGHRLMLQMCKPRSREPLTWWEDDERMGTLRQYCKTDVEVERTVYAALPSVGSARERKIWILDQEMNSRGIAVDRAFIHACQRHVTSGLKQVNSRIREIIPGATVSKVAVLTRWVQEQVGTPIPSLDKHALLELLAREDLSPSVREVLELRQQGAKSSTAKLTRMLEMACEDARVRDQLLYFGASTGRWSGKGVQIQNFPRPALKRIDAWYPAIQECSTEYLDRISPEPVLSLLSSALRGCLVSSPGQDFLAADFSQIEARVLAWMAGAEKLLTGFRQERSDIYERMGSVIFGLPVEVVTQGHISGENPLWRFVGKAAILGAGFQMGPGAFQAQVHKQGGVTLDDETAQRAIFAYRNEHWQIPALWYAMQETATSVVRERIGEWRWVPSCAAGYGFRFREPWLEFHLPSRRSLWYYKPRLGVKAAPWDPDQELETLFYSGVNSVTRQWGPQDLYGGKLVENAVQATARDVMVEGMFAAAEAGYRNCFTVHDEIVTEVPEGQKSVEDFVALITRPVEWAPHLPIAAEGWRGKRYRK